MRIGLSALIFLLSFVYSAPARAGVAPVGQFPSIAVSVTPCVYALPLLLVEEAGEWKDFGLQAALRIHAGAEEQSEGLAANEWEVAVMEPFHAVKGGNEGEMAIVGLAGNWAGRITLVFRKGTAPPSLDQLAAWMRGKRILCPAPSAEHFLLSTLMAGVKNHELPFPVLALKGMSAEEALDQGKAEAAVMHAPYAAVLARKGFPSLALPGRGPLFLPACLVGAASYADTRKTLVIRWLEGYARGIAMIRKNPAAAAARLKGFYLETLKLDVEQQVLEQEIREAFLFDEKERDAAFRRQGESASRMEAAADALARYAVTMKSLQERKGPGEYVRGEICAQLVSLRGEAEAQLTKTRAAIDSAAQAGVGVEKFRRSWEEARTQIREGRGCLTVIGILSDLERSAEGAKAGTERLRKFRRIEMGIGGLLALYYAGYAVRRRKLHRRL